MANLYPWIKALHIIAVIAFMAGMLYLPRLFVYHADTPKGSQQSETFKIMERRLELGIILPALIVMLASGAFLAIEGDFLSAKWFHGKLLGVAGLVGAYVFLAWARREFAADKNQQSAKFYRILNEVPTLLMIGIVVLVVVKPFG
jgi:putative membrane protein